MDDDRLDRHIEVSNGKFDRLEDKINEVLAKINNGLTERTILTQQTLNEVKKEQTEFRERFLEHELMEKVNVEKTHEALDRFNEAIEKLSGINQSWTSRGTKAVWVASLGIAVAALWVIAKFEAFGQVFGPLFK